MVGEGSSWYFRRIVSALPRGVAEADTAPPADIAAAADTPDTVDKADCGSSREAQQQKQKTQVCFKHNMKLFE